MPENEIDRTKRAASAALRVQREAKGYISRVAADLDLENAIREYEAARAKLGPRVGVREQACSIAKPKEKRRWT